MWMAIESDTLQGNLIRPISSPISNSTRGSNVVATPSLSCIYKLRTDMIIPGFHNVNISADDAFIPRECRHSKWCCAAFQPSAKQCTTTMVILLISQQRRAAAKPVNTRRLGKKVGIFLKINLKKRKEMQTSIFYLCCSIYKY